MVVLYGRDGSQLAYNDDAGGTLNSALDYTPAQSGEIFVEARNFDRRMADNLEERLVTPYVSFKRSDVDIANQDCVACVCSLLSRPFGQFVEESQLVREFRIDIGVRFVAACRHIEIVQFNPSFTYTHVDAQVPRIALRTKIAASAFG